MTEGPLVTLEQTDRGRLIRPHDAEYDDARALYNGMIDKRPRLIARCVDVADVIAAVTFAREESLLLALRGGGVESSRGAGTIGEAYLLPRVSSRGASIASP